MWRRRSTCVPGLVPAYTTAITATQRAMTKPADWTMLPRPGESFVMVEFQEIGFLQSRTGCPTFRTKEQQR